MTTLVVLVGLTALAWDGARLPWPWVALMVAATAMVLVRASGPSSTACSSMPRSGPDFLWSGNAPARGPFGSALQDYLGCDV